MLYFTDYKKKTKKFIELNRKSFIHKYINCTNNNASFLVLGLGHKTNISYNILLKFLNTKKFCLFFTKTHSSLSILQNAQLSNIFTALTNYTGFCYLYTSLTEYDDILKIINNSTIFFLFFLIKNKLLLNKTRILRLLSYKTLFFYGFAHVFYNQITLKTNITYF